MILYHFTKPSLLHRIEREGLRADADPTHDRERFLSGGIPCVWFYDVSERPIVSEQFAREYGEGYLQNLATAFLRLTVSISSNDSRLHPWAPWACAYLLGMKAGSLPAECRESLARCYIFFGDVKPRKIRERLLIRPHHDDTELCKMFDEETGQLGIAA